MKKEFAILPFNTTSINDKHLVSNALGSWDFLDHDEIRMLNAFAVKKDTPLFKRLHERGIVADVLNIERLIGEYRDLNSNLFRDTSLHIAVVTTRCNLACKYCQTKVDDPQDMTYEVASRILKYIFDVRTNAVTLEFQGGEPLMNWEIVAFLIEHARKFNKTGKDLKIALVSNFVLMNNEIMDFLVKYDVEVCVSLDGPREVHDRQRILHNGKGTYDIVVKNIKKFKTKHGRHVHLLPTITKYSMRHFKKIIDEYVNLGQTEIALRPANRMGSASCHWLDMGYSAEEFIEFYHKAMEYIFKLNKKGILIRERSAKLILAKILAKKDPGFVEMMNPCGAGRSTIVYMPEGSCYPCDEARMTGEEMFKLGNVLHENYDDLMKKDSLFHLLEASLINLWDYRSAFAPWMGTCPVVNYTLQKNLVPKICCSPLHKIMSAQFRYVFEKIIDHQGSMGLFSSWLKGGNDGKEAES